MAWSPSVVSSCFLPLFLCPFLAVVAVVFPSGLFGFLPSFLARSLSEARSLSPPPSLCPFWGHLILPSSCFTSTLFVLFLFSYSCYFFSLSYAFSFVSPRAPPRPLSPPAILFFVGGFFSHSFFLRRVLLSPASSSSASLASSARVSRVSGVSSS